MKFSETWLREWVDPPLTTEELGNRLTMAGLELDSITSAAPDFRGVVVSRIVKVAPHPNADRLNLCEVDAGREECLQVVCGAQNVVAGMYAPLAVVGAVLPGGLEIKESVLRGVESFGMLCSSHELGLTESATGIMCLDESAPLGADIRHYLKLDDAIFEIDLTPNRADCLGIEGVARELAALTTVSLHSLHEVQIEADNGQRVRVTIVSPELCPRYAGRVIKAINPTASTPWWMRERLRRCGIRSIGPVVDVTNYVMLELGQPMHAFDLAQLSGGIQVRLAHHGDELQLLDGQRLTLDTETLVIADDQRVLALAGIMGGLASGVTDETQDLFLESAFFNPQAIAGRARKYGLHTDSSHRFERGVDPSLQSRAIERATALLLGIVGGEPGPVLDIVSREYLPQNPRIALRQSRVERLLGIPVPHAEVVRCLTALGCALSEYDGGWRVTPPSFRFDLNIEADLIEEVARLVGYDAIPGARLEYNPTIRPIDEAGQPISRFRKLLVDRGYQEAVTFSFIDPDWEELFHPGGMPKRLANPISTEMAAMRTTLWPGLIKATLHNLNRQQTRLKLFETGGSFMTTPSGVEQTPMLAGLVTGDVLPQQWGVKSQAVDFYDLKGDVEALLAIAGLLDQVEFRAASHPALHPGQSAALYQEGHCRGWLGALHPSIEHKLGIEQRLFLFEIELNLLKQGGMPLFKPWSRYPAIRRDISVIVDQSIQADQLKQCVYRESIDALQECQVIDVYTGKGIDSKQKSIALGLKIQDFSRTLTDLEVDKIVTRILSRLERELGALLRE